MSLCCSCVVNPLWMRIQSRFWGEFLGAILTFIRLLSSYLFKTYILCMYGCMKIEKWNVFSYVFFDALCNYILRGIVCDKCRIQMASLPNEFFDDRPNFKVQTNTLHNKSFIHWWWASKYLCFWVNCLLQVGHWNGCTLRCVLIWTFRLYLRENVLLHSPHWMRLSLWLSLILCFDSIRLGDCDCGCCICCWFCMIGTFGMSEMCNGTVLLFGYVGWEQTNGICRGVVVGIVVGWTSLSLWIASANWLKYKFCCTFTGGKLGIAVGTFTFIGIDEIGGGMLLLIWLLTNVGCGRVCVNGRDVHVGTCTLHVWFCGLNACGKSNILILLPSIDKINIWRLLLSTIVLKDWLEHKWNVRSGNLSGVSYWTKNEIL